MALSHHAKGLLITAAGVFCISPDGLLTRLITADALTITLFRGFFYGIGMMLLLGLYYRRNLVRAFLSIGFPGLLLMVLYAVGNLSFIYSITHTSVASTLFIIATTPLFAALISWLLFGDRVKTRTWVTIAIATIGIYIICDAPGLSPESIKGNFVGLVAAFTLAASFSLVERNRDRDLLPSFVLGGFAVATVLLPVVDVAATSRSDLFYLFVMGFLLLPIANALMFLGPKYLSAPEVGLMMLLESVLGPFWVWLALNETVSKTVLIGGAIVLSVLAVNSILTIIRPDDNHQ